jgi:hypothetical protein
MSNSLDGRFIPTPEKSPEPKARVFFIRHSKASYQNYVDKLASDEPESMMDVEAQVPDLPEAGIELAKKNAAEFFSRFDPLKDRFYLVSSSQMRALETAKIYADTALEMGFEVVKHEKEDPKTGKQGLKTGTGVAERVGEGYVRSINALSLTMENQVFGNIFNPPANMPEINWDKISSENRARFDEAYKIVQADDKGSWGGNFYAHAEEVKKLIPEVETPRELNETQFRRIQKLATWGRERATDDKQLNVLGFGHENYMGAALEEHTGQHSIGNVEAIELREDGSLDRV